MTLVDVSDQNLRNPLINSTLHSQSRETDYCEHCVDSATGLAVSLVNTCIQETAQNEKQEMILFKFLKLQELLLKTCDINWVRLNQQFIESPRSTRFNYDTKFQNFSKNNRLSSTSSNSIQLNSQGYVFVSPYCILRNLVTSVCVHLANILNCDPKVSLYIYIYAEMDLE